MDSTIFYLTIVFIIVFYIYKKLATHDDDTLESLGVAHPKPWPIVGNALPVFLQQIGFMDFVEDLYKQYSDQKVFGFYSFFGSYTLLVSDPELVKQIMVKDFSHFMNRDEPAQNDTDRLLSKSVLMLRDQKWKDMRATLSPVYTTSKMKQMFDLLLECATDFISFYEEKSLKAQSCLVVETHDVFARVTADEIAATALGFKGDCVRNQSSKMYEIAEAIESDFTNPTTNTLVNTSPFLFKFFGKQIFRKSVHEFFEVNVLGEMKRRRELNIHRPDVIQLLVQAQDGKLKPEAGDETDETNITSKLYKISKWTDEELVAQALILFLGGFETTAALLQICCWELAKNPDVQQKLYEEVESVSESTDGEPISYDNLTQMKYLEMVILETLRKWPAFRVTPRYCEKDCLLKVDAGKSIKIRSGTEITIPIGAIQRDPKYFENPDKFDPLRFSDENKEKIQSGSFLPFGLGPRICIGSRFAMLQAKLLMFSVISKFEIVTCNGTPDNVNFSDGTLGYKEQIYVGLKLRK